MLKIKTEFPDALDSPDYLAPLGAMENNCSNPKFLSEIIRIAEDIKTSKKFSYLDLGCAGGQAVIDLYELGHISCGIDGSNLDIMLKGLNRDKTTNQVGSNWRKYKDICLFKSDITKSFEVINEKDEIQKFDVVAAWDVMEHPKEEDIPNVIENIKKHMHKNSLFIAIIGISGSGPFQGFEHHQCIKLRQWWLDMFGNYDMYDIGFSMTASPRMANPAFEVNETPFIFKQKFI